MFALYKTHLLHPIFAVFTLFGIRKAKVICRKKVFANYQWSQEQKEAFYLAYRSSLILAYCSKISSPKKSLVWFDLINDKLIFSTSKSSVQQKVDLHNSLLGKELYVEMLPFHHRQFFEPSFFISGLAELTKEIRTGSSLEDVEEGKMFILS